MSKLLMTVYNDITNDARVLRAAKALASEYEVYLFAVGTVDIAGVTSIPVDGVEKIGGITAYTKYIRGILKITKMLHPDIVYGHDIFSAIPLNILRNTRRKCKYIYDAHELFTIEKGHKYSLSDRMQYSAESKIIRHADLTICAEAQRSKIMVQYHNLRRAPLVIRNISYLPEGDANSFINNNSDFFAKKAISVVYAGGLLKGRKLELLVEAINKFGNGYKLMLIGNGPAWGSLSDQIKKYNNPNIRLCAAVPYTSLGAILSKFDIGYLFYGTDSLNNLYCAPNKIYEYASVGLPILANENPTVKGIISSFGIGVCDNDICSGLKELSAKFDQCRDNMKHFIANNSYDSEMEYLCSAVKTL